MDFVSGSYDLYNGFSSVLTGFDSSWFEDCYTAFYLDSVDFASLGFDGSAGFSTATYNFVSTGFYGASDCFASVGLDDGPDGFVSVGISVLSDVFISMGLDFGSAGISVFSIYLASVCLLSA